MKLLLFAFVGYVHINLLIVHGSSASANGNAASEARFEHHSPSALTKLDGRIVGGVKVNIEDVPYQISLQYLWRHICGGTLIGSKYVVTAAHCTNGIHDSSVFKVRAGSSLHQSGGILRSVKRMYQHPEYNSTSIDYDVCVLELYSPIYFSNVARPIPVNDGSLDLPEGTPAVVSGWGYLVENGNAPHELHAVRVPIISLAKCAAAYSRSAITPRMICAGVDEGGMDACQGDSGGPLVAKGRLVGIVSWGYGCARPRFPGVYTYVAAVWDFIRIIYKP